MISFCSDCLGVSAYRWLGATGKVGVYRGAREAPQSARDWSVFVLLLFAEVRLEDHELMILVPKAEVHGGCVSKQETRGACTPVRSRR